MSSVFDGLAPTFVAALGDDTAFPYTTQGGVRVDVYGIFENPTVMDGGNPDGVGDIHRMAKLSVAEADLPAGYGQGDAVEARGKSYTVRAALPDGRGMVDLELEALK